MYYKYLEIMGDNKPIVIENEKLSNLKVQKSSLTADDPSLDEMKSELDAALGLGKALNNNVKIVFNTSIGPCEVQTSIWTTTEKNIILKGGKALPFDCVESISLK